MIASYDEMVWLSDERFLGFEESENEKEDREGREGKKVITIPLIRILVCKQQN